MPCLSFSQGTPQDELRARSAFLLQGTYSSFSTRSASSKDVDAWWIQALVCTSHRQSTCSPTQQMLGKSTAFCNAEANSRRRRWTSAASSIKPHSRLLPSPTPSPPLTAFLWESGFSGTKEQNQSGFWSGGGHSHGRGESMQSSTRCPWARLPLPSKANTQELARVSHVFFCHHRLSLTFYK